MFTVVSQRAKNKNNKVVEASDSRRMACGGGKGYSCPKSNDSVLKVRKGSKN